MPSTNVHNYGVSWWIFKYKHGMAFSGPPKRAFCLEIHFVWYRCHLTCFLLVINCWGLLFSSLYFLFLCHFVLGMRYYYNHVHSSQSPGGEVCHVANKLWNEYPKPRAALIPELELPETALWALWDDRIDICYVWLGHCFWKIFN